MTANETLAAARPRRSLRRLALTASAGIVMTLLPVASTAGAETFTDPADRCIPPLPGQPDQGVPPAPVSDRDQVSEVHKQSVDCVFEMDIARGFTDGTYGPMASTTRGQMATFIINSLRAAGYELPAGGDTAFTDIQGTTHEENIKVLEEIKVTNGATPTTYNPHALIRRDQMASYLVQAAEYAFGDREPLEGVEPFAVGDEPVPAFPDVPPANMHYDNVNSGALVLGLLDGKSSGLYDPDMNVNREQMASFLVRLVDLTLIVE
ncbi:MAG: S-layer homology domain-containing protein [Actinomycetota bacterium]|nr:S-layer homology domain-containing protein [Actinomycetota bacterium]